MVEALFDRHLYHRLFMEIFSVYLSCLPIRFKALPALNHSI